MGIAVYLNGGFKFSKKTSQNTNQMLTTVKTTTTKQGETTTTVTQNYEEGILKNNNVNDIKQNNKINIYIFWGYGCPHCSALGKYIETINDDYNKYYNLYTFEVWHNEDNAKLMQLFAKIMDKEADGVPFMIIGKTVFTGYTESYNDQITAAIKKEYKNTTHYDVFTEYKN